MRANLNHRKRQVIGMLLLGAAALALTGCSFTNPFWSSYPDAPKDSDYAKDWVYRVGPGDSLNIFVWCNPAFSHTVIVRPDGLFSTPLVK